MYRFFKLFPARRPTGSPRGGRFVVEASAVPAEAFVGVDFDSYPEEATCMAISFKIAGKSSMRVARAALEEKFRALGEGAAWLHDIKDVAPHVQYVVGRKRWQWLPARHYSFGPDPAMWVRK